ncbi:retron St85 family RNA-directed DNA polymerase [Vibrio mediterranei]|nr:retron St85 family RNA-directed DNA polymerase [Vibrio mediterranei]
MKIIPVLQQKLTEEKSVSRADFKKLLALGSHAYKVYTIPKRKAGSRTIAHPSVNLKKCQRQLSSILETILPVDDSSYAYMKGRSIKDNALVHANSSYLLKMDFQDFFNSITPEILSRHLDRLDLELSLEEMRQLNQLIFWNPSKKRYGKLILSVGSPISPFISNSIMYFFDRELSKILLPHKINYSRYADDLTFSTNHKGLLFSVPDIVNSLLEREFHGQIILNHRKTVFSSKAHNRHVTGITINNKNQLSLGRKRKRYISSLIFNYLNSRLSKDEIHHLKGMLAFCHDIEPMFLYRMSRKYNINIINEILKKAD